MTNFEKLDRLIPQYGENKQQLDMYDKRCKEDNKAIKDIMTDLVLERYIAGGYRVVRSVTVRESMDEDLLLDILKQNCATDQLKNLIKTKEYVDMDALEKALYNGEIDKDTILAMDKAKTSKTVTSLRISKLKED